MDIKEELVLARKYIRSFIKKGKEDGEQLSTSNIQYYNKGEIIYVSDIYKRQLFSYSVDSLRCAQCSATPIDIIDFDSREIFKPVVLVDEKIVDLHSNYGADSIKSLSLFDLKGNSINEFGDYPIYSNVAGNYEADQLINTYMSGLNTSEDYSKIMLNYLYADFIDIYDDKANLIKRLEGPGDIIPRFRTVNIRGGKAAIPRRSTGRSYTGNMLMNEFLLVLYNGSIVDENDYHASKLFRFDSSFLPHTIYHLDYPIFTFDIDWTSKTIYGLAHDAPDGYSIVKYIL